MACQEALAGLAGWRGHGDGSPGYLAGPLLSTSMWDCRERTALCRGSAERGGARCAHKARRGGPSIPGQCPGSGSHKAGAWAFSPFSIGPHSKTLIRGPPAPCGCPTLRLCSHENRREDGSTGRDGRAPSPGERVSLGHPTHHRAGVL